MYRRQRCVSVYPRFRSAFVPRL